MILASFQYLHKKNVSIVYDIIDVEGGPGTSGAGRGKKRSSISNPGYNFSFLSNT